MNHGECHYHSFPTSLCPPSTQCSLLSRVGTLQLKNMEDSYSWSLGVGLGYINTDFEQEGGFWREGSPVQVKFLLKRWLSNSTDLWLNSLSLFDVMLAEFNLLKDIFSTVICSWHFIHSFIDLRSMPLNGAQHKALLSWNLKCSGENWLWAGVGIDNKLISKTVCHIVISVTEECKNGRGMKNAKEGASNRVVRGDILRRW